jgi:hypothetical protein
LSLSACADLRSSPVPETRDAAASSPPTAADDSAEASAPAPKYSLLPVAEKLPLTTYRAVFAVARDRVIVVGDETLLDWDGYRWTATIVSGVEFSGVWADDTLAYAVGTMRGTNRGLIYIRGPKTNWIEFASVEFGLRSIWGSERFRIATGNDGAAYFGFEPVPFKNAVKHERPPTAPPTLFAPILSQVGGNSAKHVIAAGGVGAFYGYDGATWKEYTENVDTTRVFRSVWGPPSSELDVFLGANYYGLWRFRGTKDPVTGERRPADIVHEERDEVIRANQSVNGIWGLDADRIVAVGTGGRLMTCNPATMITRIVPTPAGAYDLWGISGTAADDVWVVGDAGIVLHGSIEF